MEAMVKEKETELINTFIKGDERSFNEIIRTYQKNIYWHARRMVGNHLDADEVTQQVIIVIYQKLNTFKFNSSLKTWIYKITQTRCLNLLKRRKVRQFFSIDDLLTNNSKSSEDIATNVEDKDKLDRLEETLKALPTKQREVFVLRHFDELNYQEIAEITGKSVGGLKANYFHAAKKIFGMMEDE